jgi:lipid-A-disaccharide synthase
MQKSSLLILAGEASGDYHAAALIEDLRKRRPGIEASGIGGDRLAAAGVKLFHHYSEVNTIALSEGLGKLRNILAAYSTMKDELKSGRYDLFVPVDFPDVNLRLCKIAKSAGVPVCYYISPQVWAWRRGRVRKIAARVDRMMTIFPFEETLYRKAGVRADFVGHTMVRDVPNLADKGALRRELGTDENVYTVALVPGSRPAEIRRMLPVMCQAAALHMRDFPDTRFLIPLAGDHLSGLVHEIAAEHRIPATISSQGASLVMAAADSGLVTSGTATLQAALAEMPHVVVYKVDPLTWRLGLYVVKPLLMEKDVHLAIANVLAINAEHGGGPIGEIASAGYSIKCQECGRPLFVPELLQDDATPGSLAQWIARFSTEQELRNAMIRGFRQIRAMLTLPASGRAAADIVVEMLDGNS